MRMSDPLPQIYYSRINPLFPSSVNPSEAAQHLIRMTKSCLSSVLMLFIELSPEGLRSATCVPSRECPLQRSFERAITPDKPSPAPLLP